MELLLYQLFGFFFGSCDKTHCGHLFSSSISYHCIVEDEESFLWNITPAQSMPPGQAYCIPPPTPSVLQGEKGTFEPQRKYWCKENMSFQNKRARIMSRQMVLRRILSNGDDRQADRLAQTLPLRRPGERPGQFLSLSMSRPPPPPLPPHPPPVSFFITYFFFLTSSCFVLFQQFWASPYNM